MGPSYHIPTLGVFSCEPTPRGWDGLVSAWASRERGLSARVVLLGRGQLYIAGSLDPSSQPWLHTQAHPGALSRLHVQRAEGF